MTTGAITSSRPQTGVHTSSSAAKLAVFARDIKVSHTIFAMPWALLSMVLAGHQAGTRLTALKVMLIVLCMVTARTAAMAANRLLDAELDAKNPRTARRAVPGGLLSRGFVAGILALCAVGFVVACAGFWFAYRNPWPVILSVPVLLFLGGYPLLKRFTRLCHYYLGAALALAPVCAWVAVRGSLALPPLLMAAAVLTWTAGFDIIYACQDYDSDVACGVFSVPAKLGIRRALWVSRLTHISCVAMLATLGRVVPEFRVFYFIGVALAAALLAIEHSLVKPSDLSKVGLAFFTVNGVISVVLGGLGIVDVLR